MTGEWWIRKDLQQSGRGVTKALSRHLPGVTEGEKTKTSVMTVDDPTKIRIETSTALPLCQPSRYDGVT
jgi:hypothetical protein